MLLLPAILTISLTASAGDIKSRPNDDVLTQEFAQFRKGQIQSVSYSLKFTFTPSSTDFHGETTMDVTLNRTDKPLSIDFVGKKLISVKVNGKAVKPTSRKGSFDISSKALATSNRIEISYIGSFSKDGYGTQRVVDPVDKAVYIYSDAEPYFAHMLFPSFDQPDLKAVFNLQATVPKDWKVISNDVIRETVPQGENITVHFQPTKPISTYLFFIGAGPYVEIKDKYGDVPLYLYVRQTLAKYVDADRWFEATKKGLKFFNDYFGTPYPFPKYAHVFAPEFSWGGMENPGAVTVNEANIFREPMPEARYEGRNSLILHEMAHMWFGDLVTMKWWDDLWLNESFASYLAVIAGERAFKAKTAPLDSVSSKGWAYWQDQLVTTHPIEAKVPDTRTARGNFDGITYAKGGASLKQLHFFVGEEGFRNGLKSYFKKFAYQNTTRADFIGEIGTASNMNLDNWTRAWLQTAGPNRVQTKWSCEDGRIVDFSIEQQPSSSKTLSPHKTRLGLYKANGSKLDLKSTEDVIYTAENNPVPSLVGKKCPDFVAPNLEDYDYALFSLDETSKKYAKLVLDGGVPQSTLRMQTWSMLNQMVRDRKMPVREYLELAMSGLENESDEALLSQLLNRYSSIRENYYNYLTVGERKGLAPRFEGILQKRISEQKPGSNLQMTLFDFYVSVVQTKEAQTALAEMLKGAGVPKGLELGQERRWGIVQQLANLGFAEVKSIIDGEEKNDPTTLGKRNAFAARAALPEKPAKEKFWRLLERPEQVSFAMLRSASGNFHNHNNPELSRPYVKPFFKRVTTMNWAANDSLVEIYFERIFPGPICTRQLLRESEQNFKSANNLTPLSRRAWLEANEELSKCVSIRTQETNQRQI